jgi:hypothetical protein
MAEFEHLPKPIQEIVVDGHRPLHDALAATVAEALEGQDARDPTTVLALIDAVTAAATRQAVTGLSDPLRAETRHAVASILSPGIG